MELVLYFSTVPSRCVIFHTIRDNVPIISFTSCHFPNSASETVPKVSAPMVLIVLKKWNEANTKLKLR